MRAYVLGGDVLVRIEDARAGALVTPWLDGLPTRNAVGSVRIRAGGGKSVGVPARPRDAFFGAIDVWAGAGAHVLATQDARVRVEGAVVRIEGDARSAPPWLGLLALALALRTEGLYHLHAGAAQTDAGPVLVVGGSGAGKTTTVLALLAHLPGARSLGDDSVFLRGGPHIVPLARPFHASDATVAMFPSFAARATGSVVEGTRKRVLALDPPEGPAGAPALIVLPEVTTDALTTASRVAPADALAALVAQSALVALPGVAGRTAHLALLAEMVDGAPTVALRLGLDAVQDPLAVVVALEPYLRR